MTLARATIALSISTLLALVACVPQTEVIKLYDESANLDKQYERLLILSIVNDTGIRRRLEELIASNLQAVNVPAVASYTETGLKKTLLQDEIDEAAKNSEADGILITHVASIDTRLSVEPDTGVLAECRGDESMQYSLYGRRELKQPDSVAVAHTVVVITNLYDASDGRRLWSIQSTCFEKANMDEVLQEEAKAIVRQLQIDKLVS